jgi:putative ABC transport system permease protein
MIRNYFKIAWRQLIKNKGYSLINIGGLAIGITAYILITQYVNFESGYDRQQPRIDDLYRVTLTTNLGSKGFVTSAANHPALGPAMKQDFPEVESFTRVVDRTIMTGAFILSYTKPDGTQIKSSINDDLLYLADSTFFDLFKVKLIKGNPKSALTKPMSIVLSTETAKRFFGNEDPIGKSLKGNNNFPLQVTGVFEELPENTHLKFNMLISFTTLGKTANESWVWPEFYNYIRLKPGTDPASVEAKFPDFVKKYLGEIMQEHGFEARFGLQPVRDIHLKSHLTNEIAANASEKMLNFLRIIAIFIILIALINFVNLSTAKSTERAMEVGLKKVVGITKGALIGQFLFESLIINLIAAIFAVIMVSAFIQPFNDLIGFQVLTMDIWFQPRIWLQLTILIVLGGLLAGAYPAFVLSSFKPIQVLKGKFHQSESGAWMRKGLVISQFAISIALITGTFIIHSQFSYMKNQDLGYDSEHNFIVNAPMVVDSTITDKMEVFKNELKRNPKINSVTASGEIPGKKIIWYNTTRRVHERKEESVICYQLNIDYDFLDTYKIKLLAGRNFRKEDRSTYGFGDPNIPRKESGILINEAASKVLGFGSAEEAVQSKIIFVLGPKDHTATIIGVTENYHQQSLQNEFEPIIFLSWDNFNAAYLTINMNTTNVQATIADIGNKYEKFFPMDPYNYFFLDEHFNRQYEADLKLGKIFLLFAGLAIFIAALGLFGLGSYMALKKTKELCIRKVLGASVIQVLILIPKSLLILVLISGLIAIPITYFMAAEWLSDYAFRITINPWMFIIPLSLVIAIAALSVLPESIKVALLNPSKYLRNE